MSRDFKIKEQLKVNLPSIAVSTRTDTKLSLNRDYYLEKEITSHESLGPGSQTFRKGVNLCNTRVLKVSLQFAASYASYSQKREGESDTPTSTRVKEAEYIPEYNVATKTNVFVSSILHDIM